MPADFQFRILRNVRSMPQGWAWSLEERRGLMRFRDRASLPGRIIVFVLFLVAGDRPVLIDFHEFEMKLKRIGSFTGNK